MSVEFKTPDLTLMDYVAMHARMTPDKLAITQGERTVTWGQFGDEIEKIAAGLQSLEFLKSAKIVVFANPSIDSICCQFAALRASGSVMSISSTIADDDLLRAIQDGRPEILVADESQISRLERLRQSVSHQLARHYVGLSENLPPGWIELNTLKGDFGPCTIWPKGNDDFGIIYSSGTTSQPKGIVISHRSRLENALILALVWQFSADSIGIVNIALYSNTTWSILITAFVAGGAVVISDGFDAKGFCDDVERHGVTHTLMVPTQFQRLLDELEARPRNLSTLQSVATVGSLMPLRLKERLAKRFPHRFCEFYGMTEGFVTFLGAQEFNEKISSVGRPVPGNDVRVIDDDDREVPREVVGELVGFGPQIMRGYYNDAARTAEVMWLEPGSGRYFIRSGDIGRMDRDGFVYLIDRKKDMLISGGANIYPADLERVLFEHPDVLDAAVVGVSNSRWGETPVAVVVLKTGSGTDESSLLAWANERLGKQQRISRIHFATELPRNAAGKVLKAQLRVSHGTQ